MLLGITRADFYNPFSQFILTVTNPILTPLRKFIPSVSGLDTAAIVLILVLKFIELALRSIFTGKQILLSSLILPTIIGVLQQVLNIFIFAIIILVIISWVAPYMHGQSNPLTPILRSLTEPLIRPARKLIPPVGIFDLSTLVVLLVLYCIKIFLHSL
jgi:YggT family protein